MTGNRTFHYEFGPFRLDADDRLLKREGKVVPLTPKVFDTLLLLVEHHEHVLTKEPPPVDGTDAYAEFIGRRYEHVRDDFKQADGECERLIARLKEIRGVISLAESDKKLIENTLKAWIGDAAGVDSTEGRFTYKPQGGTARPDYQEICTKLCDRLLTVPVPSCVSARRQPWRPTSSFTSLIRPTLWRRRSRRVCR